MRTKLCLFVLLLLASHGFAQSVIHGRVVAVSDGDSMRVVTTNQQRLVVHVAFVDAPERGQPFANLAKQLMSQLVFGKDVELRPHGIDRYGHSIATVFIHGRDAGLELIKAGLAWAYERYLPQASPETQAEYSAAETAARVSRIGLWKDNDPQPPWDWRKTERERRARTILIHEP